MTPEQKAAHELKIKATEERLGFKVCGARNQQGEPCGRKAGEGTDHEGVGRCYFHGGLNQSPASKNWKSGLRTNDRGNGAPAYPTISQKVEQLRQDRDVFDLREHIFVSEAIASQLLEDAQSKGDLIDLVNVIEKITKSVQRLHEIEVGRRYVISVDNLGNVIGKVVEVIERHIPDPYLRSLIADDIMRINQIKIPAMDARLVEAQLERERLALES